MPRRQQKVPPATPEWSDGMFLKNRGPWKPQRIYKKYLELMGVRFRDSIGSVLRNSEVIRCEA